MPLSTHIQSSRTFQNPSTEQPTLLVNELQQSGLIIYQISPPEWRLPTQVNQAELGFPGLHPPHVGQHEDAITKYLVQWGFTPQTLVPTESFSAHQMIYKKITDDSSFKVSSAALSALIEARRRFYALNNYDTKSTLKVPGRVTLNDQKRENWLRDLADTSVPLLKLSKNVPHGFKGEKLLDMLVNRKLDSSRAVWYIRLIGLSEINAQRNKNELSHVRYTLSFTSEVCQFLQKQLAEVTVPLQMSSSTASLITTSSRLAGMNVRSKPRSSTLSDPETRKTWVAKWNQICLLLKRLYFESLLDQPTFFKWIVDQLKVANLAQINFILEIHHSVLDRFNLSSNLVRAFVEACLSQIRFISKQAEIPYLSKLQHRLKLAIQTAFIFCPENFVWPDLWTSNKKLLQETILSNSPTVTSTNASLTQGHQHQLREMMKVDFFAVNWRVSELIGDVGIGTGIVGNIFTRRAHLVEILDSYTDYHDASKLYYRYFLNPTVAGDIIVSFKDKLEVLLSWATTPLRTSDKRLYLVSTTLSYVKRDRKRNEDEFQNILVGWLEQIESTDGGDLLVRLFSELSRRNIFSYGAYVQRMVAKGDIDCDVLAGKASGLQALLSEWMPLVSSKSFVERRSPTKRSPGRDSARNGLMATIADMNSSIASGDCGRFLLLLRRRLDVSQPTSANRRLLAEILPNALLNLIGELLFTSCASSGPSTGNPSHCTLMVSALLIWGIRLIEATHAHATLFEFIQRIVQIDLSRIETLQIYDSPRADLNLILQSAFGYLQVICVAAHSNKEIFEINSQLADLISQLFTIYVHFRRLVAGTLPVVRGYVRCLRNLVIESKTLDGQILEVLDKENHPMFDEIIMDRLAVEPLPSRTTEILRLIQYPSVKEVSQLVLKYWEEHGSDADWGPSLWNSLLTAIRIHSQEDFQNASTPHENWWLIRETLMQFCEDLDMLYNERLVGCILRAEQMAYPHSDDEPLFVEQIHTSVIKTSPEEEEGEESEKIPAQAPTQKAIFLRNPRSICPTIRFLLVELITHGLIGIEVGLEGYAIRPLADDIPQMLVNIFGHNDPSDQASKPSQGSWMTQGEEVLRQSHEVFELVHQVLSEQNVGQSLQAFTSPKMESVAMMTSSSQSLLAGHLNFATPEYPHISTELRNGEYAIEEYVKIWRLSMERRSWLEQSDEGLAFSSRLLLSLLISIKTASELTNPGLDASDKNSTREKFEPLVKKILEEFENLRSLICQGSSLLRQTILAHPAVFLNPILDVVNKNGLGTIFHTKLIESVDGLLLYQHSKDPLNAKYPYLESIFKDTNMFNHSARTKQFELHIRLLMMDNPPQMPAMKEVPLDVTNTLGCLVEVMAKRLHLTDSKDASPFFLSCLPTPVAEALVIKLSLYLGMSICKLLGSNPSDSTPEVSRIHHICRCITALTNQLTTKTCQINDDAIVKVIGGCGPLSCNATVESYMSYWQQLKSGLSLLNARLANPSGSPRLNHKRFEYRIIRALLHSIQVVLWSLPGLTQHLGTLKQMIAEIWIEISLRVQGDSALQNQILDTIGVLLFPKVPDDSVLTATIGIIRKRFPWLSLPILNLDDGSNLAPSNRLKYLLGSSLRGSSTTFQERSKDGAIKFVEDKPWEELEKMDMSAPGFISIDALKCQTLSQVEPIPECKSKIRKETRLRREEGEDGVGEEIQRRVGRGDDALITGVVTAEYEEEAFVRGERESFEHESITDSLSTVPVHFLRSLSPPPGRLTGQDWMIGSQMQDFIKSHQAEQSKPYNQHPNQVSLATDQASLSRDKKRKSIPLSISPPPLSTTTAADNFSSQVSSSSGPTLRSARSTRKKSSAGLTSNASAGSSSKRLKKR